MYACCSTHTLRVSGMVMPKVLCPNHSNTTQVQETPCAGFSCCKSKLLLCQNNQTAEVHCIRGAVEEGRHSKWVPMFLTIYMPLRK